MNHRFDRAYGWALDSQEGQRSKAPDECAWPIAGTHRWCPGLLHEVTGQYGDPNWDEAAHML